MSNLPILMASCNNEDELTEIVNNTKVIATAAGPYDLYGTLLVELCCRYGTDYCDITGEISWVRKMIEKYDNLAV